MFRENNTFDGRVYSFPFNKSVPLIYYNADLYGELGLVPASTWDEQRRLLQALCIDANGDGDYLDGGDRWGTAFGPSVWTFECLLAQAGGSLLSADGNASAFQGAEGVEALGFLADLIYRDRTAYLSSGYDHQRDFLDGGLGQVQGSVTSLAFMEEELQRRREAGQPAFTVGVAPLPGFRRSTVYIAGTNVVLFRNEDPEVVEAGWEFIKWFTAKEQTAYWSVKTSYMPVRRSAMESEVVKDFLTKYPHYQGIYSQLEEAVYEPQSSAWFKARPELKSFLERAMRGDLTAQETVDGAAAKFAELIAAEME